MLRELFRPACLGFCCGSSFWALFFFAYVPVLGGALFCGVFGAVFGDVLRGVLAFGAAGLLMLLRFACVAALLMSLQCACVRGAPCCAILGRRGYIELLINCWVMMNRSWDPHTHMED